MKNSVGIYIEASIQNRIKIRIQNTDPFHYFFNYSNFLIHLKYRLKI